MIKCTFQSFISKGRRQLLHGHPSAVIWFYGLSGSGKSTIAHEVERKLVDLNHKAYVLDGDNIRTGLNSDLSLTQEGRTENIRRAAEVARLFSDAGLIVLCSFITPMESQREMLKEILSGSSFYDCYIKCSLDECRKRDPKKLYKLTEDGVVRGMTGVSAPFEVPKECSLTVDTEQTDIDASADQVIRFLAKRGIVRAGIRS